VEIFLKFLFAFLAGGAICMVGQLLILWTNWTPARILVSFVVVGIVLGALNWFEPIKEAVGAGITTPIVGFGGTLAKGAIKAVAEDGFIGIITGGLTAVAAGVGVAVTVALLVSLVARSRTKM
jgi:stage V sporulation protein AE